MGGEGKLHSLLIVSLLKAFAVMPTHSRRSSGGRHLLAEQLLPPGGFIPNDTLMSGGGEQGGVMQVVTG